MKIKRKEHNDIAHVYIHTCTLNIVTESYFYVFAIKNGENCVSVAYKYNVYVYKYAGHDGNNGESE